MALKLHTLDVFTERRFGGNPLAVVHDADALDGKKMQVIARELNLSETVFLLKPANPAHSRRKRGPRSGVQSQQAGSASFPISLNAAKGPRISLV